MMTTTPVSFFLFLYTQCPDDERGHQHHPSNDGDDDGYDHNNSGGGGSSHSHISVYLVLHLLNIILNFLICLV